MPIEDALRQLEAETNSQIAWGFGDILRVWATRPNWRSCLLLEQLETNHHGLAGWNELVRRTRLALVDDSDLQNKARVLLLPASIRFNDVVDDFIAELLAAQYLHALGHTEIRILSEDGEIRTDLQSRCGNYVHVSEAKNLREPRGLTKVAFRRWNTKCAEEPKRYSFTVELMDIDDPLGDLTSEQETAVLSLIDELPEWNRPVRRIRNLPGGRRISVTVRDGRPVIVKQGGGPFRVDGPDGLVANVRRGLILKLLEPTRKALVQLYADSVPSDYRRLLYLRWKPPEELCVAPEEREEVRSGIRDGVRSFVGSAFPHFAIAIAHTNEEPDQTPQVQWD